MRIFKIALTVLGYASASESTEDLALMEMPQNKQ
jgi:hypothetical protein